jgi:hypothetical protein
MRIPLKSLILFAVILISLNAKVSPSNKIKKIILVCMENHSYDNMVKSNINILINFFFNNKKIKK